MTTQSTAPALGTEKTPLADERPPNRPLSTLCLAAAPQTHRHGGLLARRNRIYHAPECDDNDSPPFPTPINRRQTPATPTLTPCDSETSANAPPSTDPLIKTITAATIAAMDRYLATLSLLRRPVEAPGVETPTSIASPRAPVVSSVLRDAPPLTSVVPNVASVAPPPAPVVPSVASVNPPPAPVVSSFPNITPPPAPVLPSVASVSPPPAPRSACSERYECNSAPCAHFAEYCECCPATCAHWHLPHFGPREFSTAPSCSQLLPPRGSRA